MKEIEGFVIIWGDKLKCYRLIEHNGRLYLDVNARARRTTAEKFAELKAKHERRICAKSS